MKSKILICALGAAMMSMPVFAETVADILQTKPEGSYRTPANQHHSLVHGPKGCYREAYRLYISNGEKTKKEKSVLRDRADKEFRGQGNTAQAIGHYIGMTIGMQMIERKSDTQLSYYKASACAIRKAGEMSITDPRMIVGAVGVVGNSYRLKKQQQAFFDDNVKTGGTDLSKLQKEQKAFAENTAAFVRMTGAIADMRCDISEGQADEIHTRYITDQFLNKMSGDALNEMNAEEKFDDKGKPVPTFREICEKHVIGLVGSAGKKKA